MRFRNTAWQSRVGRKVKFHYYGIRYNNLSWIQSFLADRNQQIVLDEKTSSLAAVTSGGPQSTGTVLGPMFTMSLAIP